MRKVSVKNERLTVDSSDLELRQVMTETDRFVEAFTALEFECDTFFTTVLLDDLSGNACSVYGWCANLGVRTVAHEENFAKINFFVSSDRELINTDCVAFRDAVLFSAGFENCVGHFR